MFLKAYDFVVILHVYPKPRTLKNCNATFKWMSAWQNGITEIAL